jgi:hypothetical protein
MVKKQTVKKLTRTDRAANIAGFEPMKMTVAISATAVVTLVLMALIAMS